MSTTPPGDPLEDRYYEELLAFRNELRRFLRWSEDRARDAGLTPALHQLLLVVRGHPDPAGPTIADIAEALRMRHHSAVELTQRAQTAGLLDRERDSADHRRVHLTLTAHGRRQLEALTREHLPRVYSLAATLKRTLPQSKQSARRSSDPAQEPLPHDDDPAGASLNPHDPRAGNAAASTRRSSPSQGRAGAALEAAPPGSTPDQPGARTTRSSADPFS